MSNPVGIMQGRLVPSRTGKLQTFPSDCWEDEFSIAATVGLSTIEWLLDADTDTENPFWHKGGCLRIKQIIRECGVAVSSICADYIQAFPLSVLDEEKRRSRGSRLSSVVELACRLGAQCVLVPCVAKDLEPDSKGQNALIKSLELALDKASYEGIKVGLEMDWPATDQCRLVNQVGHPALGVYYDFGNATSLGYNPPEDIRTIGNLLVGVHIKDRKVGGSSVILGHGDTDFVGGISALREIGYGGPLILEAPRGLDPIATARQHLAFVRKVMKSATDLERGS
jgi:L-ribulose-5-phosphate 3-epimerase